MRLRLDLVPTLVLSGLITATTYAVEQVRTGTVAQSYAQLCASCHGDKLQGGSAPSMLDEVWAHGGDDPALARSIHDGYPEKGMPPWSATLSNEQIRAFVIFIREQRAVATRAATTYSKPQNDVTVASELHRYRLQTWVEGVTEPWSLAFLPDGGALATEKRGNLIQIAKGARTGKAITGIPEVDHDSQAGLFDVVLHPDYAKNGWIYLSYSDPQKNAEGRAVALTRIIRGRVRGGAWVDQQTIFQAPLEVYPNAGGVHFGGRIVFDGKGHIFFSIGERGRGPNAQNLAVPMGKIHRLNDDGSVPADNPFVHDKSAVPSIWSYGHRNPQGLARNSATGELFDAEHGPRGGDEINLIRPGLNYGWPVITYGMNYDGTPMTDLVAKDGMEQPVTYWTPSIAVCGINYYSGDLFPQWKNNLFVASLAAEELRRLEIKDGLVVSQEVLFKSLGRIRHVIGGPDGALYVLLPERIARLSPAE
ncbi:MAG: PQQ-dependent sugar dehydrogenase [Opitutus sp.]